MGVKCQSLAENDDYDEHVIVMAAQGSDNVVLDDGASGEALGPEDDDLETVDEWPRVGGHHSHWGDLAPRFHPPGIVAESGKRAGTIREPNVDVAPAGAPRLPRPQYAPIREPARRGATPYAHEASHNPNVFQTTSTRESGVPIARHPQYFAPSLVETVPASCVPQNASAHAQRPRVMVAGHFSSDVATSVYDYTPEDATPRNVVRGAPRTELAHEVPATGWISDPPAPQFDARAPQAPVYVQQPPNRQGMPPNARMDHPVYPPQWSTQSADFLSRQQAPAAPFTQPSYGTPWLGSELVDTAAPSIPSHVDYRVAQAALRGEFIQLEQFLKCGTVFNVNNVSVNDCVNGDYFKSSRPRKMLTSFVKWSEAWGHYEMLLVSNFGIRMYQEMASYRSFLTELADKYKIPYILTYDERNRFGLGQHRSFKFTRFNQELFVTTFDANAMRSVTKCTKCSAVDHSTSDCPFRSGGQHVPNALPAGEKSKGKSVIDPEEICIKYQDGSCRFKRCPRKHCCFLCKGPNGAKSCASCSGHKQAAPIS